MKLIETLRVKMFFIMALAMVATLAIGCGSSKSSTTNPLAPAADGVLVQGRVAGEGDMSGIPVYLLGLEAQVPPNAGLRASEAATSVAGQLYFSITDSSGAFAFNDVTPGVYNLVAKKDKNLGGIRRNLAVGLAASTMPTDLELLLTATGDISGQIAVPEGYAAKSGVIAFLPGTSFAAFTDDNGYFVITGVPVGDYSVLFTAPGLARSRLDNVTVAAGHLVTLPLVTLAKDASSCAGIIWKGTQNAHPASPQLNWAYYNSTDKKAYLFDGTTWQVMSESITGPMGPQGPVGPMGPQGPVGPGLVWKGFLNTPPLNPELNWAYMSSLDGRSYLWDGSNWVTFAISDIFPPQIIRPFSQSNDINAYVYCIISEPAACRVEYGLSSSYGSLTEWEASQSVVIYSASHTVPLVDLTPSTTYHYRIIAKDIFGNESVSDDYTFTTLPPISRPAIIQGVSVAFGTSWTPSNTTHFWVSDNQFYPARGATVTFDAGTTFSTQDIIDEIDDSMKSVGARATTYFSSVDNTFRIVSNYEGSKMQLEILYSSGDFSDLGLPVGIANGSGPSKPEVFSDASTAQAFSVAWDPENDIWDPASDVSLTIADRNGNAALVNFPDLDSGFNKIYTRSEITSAISLALSNQGVSASVAFVDTDNNAATDQLVITGLDAGAAEKIVIGGTGYGQLGLAAGEHFGTD